MKLENRYDAGREFYCDLTRELDKYLIINYKLASKSYLLDYGDRMEVDNKPGHCYSIRFPGATRGHIMTDTNNIITEIKLYENKALGNIYLPEALEIIKEKFIGIRIER